MNQIDAHQVFAVIRELGFLRFQETLSFQEPLRDQGVDSLDFATILQQLEEKYGIVLPETDVAENASLDAIAAAVDRRVKQMAAIKGR